MAASEEAQALKDAYMNSIINELVEENSNLARMRPKTKEDYERKKRVLEG